MAWHAHPLAVLAVEEAHPMVRTKLLLIDFFYKMVSLEAAGEPQRCVSATNTVPYALCLFFREL